MGNGSVSFPQSSEIGDGDWVKNTTDKVMLSAETLVQISKGKSYIFNNEICICDTLKLFLILLNYIIRN